MHRNENEHLGLAMAIRESSGLAKAKDESFFESNNVPTHSIFKTGMEKLYKYS